ncbi:MAG: helix-turn-helix domain-containing protein [Terrimicrobiaceae bacterium]
MTSNSLLFRKLSRTKVARNYVRAFGDATGLPAAIVDKDDWHLSLHGARHETPFCALLVNHSKACASCLRCQSLLRKRARTKSCVTACPFGLTEAAVPIRVGADTAGYVITGQVMRDEPTEAGFQAVARKLNPTVGLDAARRAWFSTPVLTRRAFESSVYLLSQFAEHLAITGNQLALQIGNREPGVVTKARTYLATHIDEDLTLAEVARAAGASTFYLCKLFRKHLGMTFTEYLSRCRVERAKQMLLKPTARISEVAFQAGFQSLTHFNRVFRRVVGDSPTDYRHHLPTTA